MLVKIISIRKGRTIKKMIIKSCDERFSPKHSFTDASSFREGGSGVFDMEVWDE